MKSSTTSIEIGLDVYKSIITNSNYIDEPANDVLKRLLKISEGSAIPSGSNQKIENGGLMVKNVFLKSGMKLRKYFKGKLLEASVHDGYIQFNDKKFTSPSGAAVEAAQGSVNGWRFWEYLDASNNTWKLLDSLKN